MDTLKDLYLAVNHALETYGQPTRTIDEVRQFVGNGVRNLMIRAVPDGEQNPHFNDIFTEFKAYYVVHCQDNTCLYSGISETLQQLKAIGMKMAVVSNKLQAGVDELFQAYFKDTMEVGVGERIGIPRKPAPDMVDIALRELKVSKDEAIYIGDSDVDIMTARNAGLPCISVLWGFRDRDFLTQHGATTFAAKPQDIIELIK